MNRGSKATSSQSNKKKPQAAQQPQPSPSQPSASAEPSATTANPSAPQSNINSEKMQQIQDKVRELEHLLKIKDMSSQMASYFDELALSVEGLAGGAQAVSDVLSNWNHVFRAMSMVAPRQREGEDEETDAMKTDQVPDQVPDQAPPVLVRVPLALTKQMSDLSF